MMTRPDSSEYAPSYAEIISLVPEDDIVQTMSAGLAESRTFLGAISERESTVCHPPYTWTIKQVVGHLADCERIFGYRALRFARGDTTPLPGFDENSYARAAVFERAPLAELAAEFEALRRSHTILFNNLTDDDWIRRGITNQAEMSVRAIAYAIVGHERHHMAILRRRLARS